MVIALASHKCGTGLIPVLGIICGLSLLLVLVPVLRVSWGSPIFHPPQKPALRNSQIPWLMENKIKA